MGEAHGITSCRWLCVVAVVLSVGWVCCWLLRLGVVGFMVCVCAVAMLPELAAILVKLGFMVYLLAVARLLASGCLREAKQLVAVVSVLLAACFDFGGQAVGEGGG